MPKYGNLGIPKQQLGGNDISRLRAAGVLTDGEYAYVEGDFIVAENIKTQDKRILGPARELLVEGGTKRLLQG